MRTGITFDVEGLIKELNDFEKIIVPKAAEQALRSFGYDVREILQDEMRREFDSPSNYTLRSSYFRQDGLTLEVGISDRVNSGLSPAQYLNPTDKGTGGFLKPVSPTKIDGAFLKRYGIDDLVVPVASSRAGSQFLNSKGALRSRKTQYLLDQLASPGSGRESYFVVKPGDNSSLTPGVFRRYRVKSTISQVFVFAKQKQKPKIDYHDVIIKAAEERLPKLIESKLSRLLR